MPMSAQPLAASGIAWAGTCEGTNDSIGISTTSLQPHPSRMSRSVKVPRAKNVPLRHALPNTERWYGDSVQATAGVRGIFFE